MKKHYPMRRRLKAFAAITILSLLFLCESRWAHAQIPASSYTYAAVSGTFTEVTGGIAVNDIESDEDISGAIPIGFPFNFCGTDYTSVVASSNGWLSMGAPTYAVGYNDVGELNEIKAALFPLWEDLAGDLGEASYITTGTTPNRVFTFQFKNWQWNYGASGAVISFQVKLYETTNVIEYVYRQESTNVNGSFIGASIGIADDANVSNYLSLNGSSATATASSTTFTTGIVNKPANGQIFRFNPPPNCSGATFPAVAAATVFPTSVCLTGNVSLSIATAMPIVTNLKYQWQSSPTGAAPWTSINTPANLSPYSTTVSTPTYFRCRVICNGDTTAPVWVSTPTAQVTIDNPGSAVGTNGTRCGPGTLNLTATGTAGGPVLKWYANPTGGAPLGTGSPFTTPFIPVTDTFYVTAGTTVVPGVQAVGAGALTTMYDATTPFYGSYGGYKHQFLIRPSELIALGITPGTTLTSLAFDVVTAGNTFDSFAISLKNTTTTAFDDYPTDLETGAVQVKTPADHTTTAGINTFTFTTPFIWDGSSLLVQTCWSNHNFSNTTSEVKYDDVTFNATQYGMEDDAYALDVCDEPEWVGYASIEQRPKMIFGYEASCQGPRIPVIATVTPSPALVTTAPDVVCNETIGSINVTPSGTPYNTYTWTPADNIFTNATATTSYVTGTSATQLYFKATDAGEHVHYLFATNTATGCNFADTVRIWNQPGDVTIKAIPDTICNGGTSTLSLVPGTDYFPGSITWEESANGTTFTPIPGAHGTSYTTPVITTNHYYRAKINGGATDCEVPEQFIVVAHPSVVSTKDSFHCGPGPVVLEAVSGGYSEVRWYTSPTATQPVGTGSPFTTPYLGATTTYYVSGASGIPQPDPAMIGNGTNTSSYTDVPYSLDYSGSKVQYLLQASALQAAGFNAGYIISLGFDVVTAGDEVENMSIGLKLTPATTLVAPNLETGLQTVFNAATYQPVSNTVNVHTFQTPFYWDGTSNIVVEECHNNTYSGTSSEVKVIFNGSGLTNTKDEANHCANPTGNTYSTYGTQPNMQIAMQPPCESAREEVIAYIHPKPVVNLGQDINKCVDIGHETTVLDAGTQPNNGTYLWDDGSTSQVRAVDQTGIYRVKVTNSYTCVGGDTISVTLRKNPIVDLGNDTTVCNGVVLNLNAGNDGVDYFWNTGQTTNNININSPGMYIAFVTNNDACTKIDTINVTMQGELPTIQGINVTNNGGYTFSYAPVNPMNVIGYEWDFGDGTPHVYTPNAVHTYADEGNYIVVLKLSSSCGFFSDSSSAQIVGIRQLNVGNDVLTVYPNPTKSTATILNKGDLKMEQVLIYNVLGQIVYNVKADKSDAHTVTLTGFAPGVYTIQVQTDKGTVARKLEILK